MEPGYFQVKVADPGRHSFFFLLCSKEFFALDAVDGPDLKSFPCLSETKKTQLPGPRKEIQKMDPFWNPVVFRFIAGAAGKWPHFAASGIRKKNSADSFTKNDVGLDNCSISPLL